MEYYISESYFYKKSEELKEMILDYQRYQNDYKKTKYAEPYFKMLNARSEICQFLHDLKFDSDGNIDTDNEILVSLFNEICGLTYIVTNQEYLITASKSNIRDEIREDKILVDAEFLKESLEGLEKNINRLLEITNQISEIRENSKQK